MRPSHNLVRMQTKRTRDMQELRCQGADVISYGFHTNQESRT